MSENLSGRGDDESRGFPVLDARTVRAIHFALSVAELAFPSLPTRKQLHAVLDGTVRLHDPEAGPHRAAIGRALKFTGQVRARVVRFQSVEILQDLGMGEI